MYIQKEPIILASKSPRRQELMNLMGLNFRVELEDVDESYPQGLKPSEIAMYISEKKAKAFGSISDHILITADTIVAVGGEILGKPTDRTDAQQMLSKLSGGTHDVYTGVTIVRGGVVVSFYDLTEVVCREVTAQEIDFYIDNFKPYDKAGSYGIQDWWGITVVKRLQGSYTNVMGLPTEKLYETLATL